MSDIVEILMHWHAGRKKAVVARSLGVDRGTVSKYVAALSLPCDMLGPDCRSASSWLGPTRTSFWNSRAPTSGARTSIRGYAASLAFWIGLPSLGIGDSRPPPQREGDRLCGA